eukprot:9544638-Prorocentrum_lima.AAC.1
MKVEDATQRKSLRGHANLGGEGRGARRRHDPHISYCAHARKKAWEQNKGCRQNAALKEC